METKLSKTDVIKVNDLIQSFETSKSADASLEQNMVKFYLEQFPGTFPEEANDIVVKIKAGVSTFNETLNEAISENGIDYVAKLKAMGEGKTNEEQYELYVNFLSALMTLEVSNFGGENCEPIDSFDEIKGNLFTVNENALISDEELDEVINKVAEALNNNTFTMSSAEAINQLIDKLPVGTAGAKEIIRGSKEDVHNKMITSLATYIEHQKGELEATAGVDLTVEQITVNVCTGIEEAKILTDAKNGIITVDNAIKLLKILGGVALAALLGYMFASSVAYVSSLVFGFIIAAFGTSTFVMVIASVVGLLIAVGSIYGLGTEVIPKILEWVGKAFDKVVSVWREKALPYVKEKADAFGVWVQEQKEENRVKVVDNVNLNEVIVNA